MKKLLAAALLLAGLASAPAEGATIVDTGPGPNGNSGFSILNFSPTSANFLAAEFTLATPEVIDTIEGWIKSLAANNLVISLYSAAGETPSGTPASPLFSAGFTSVAGDAAWQGVDVNWSLASGTYWVSFETMQGQNSSFMPTVSGSPANPLGDEAFWNGTQWFANDGQNVGIRIMSVDPVMGTVPEPTAWTMLILGFGALGAALRVRRRQLRVA